MPNRNRTALLNKGKVRQKVLELSDELVREGEIKIGPTEISDQVYEKLEEIMEDVLMQAVAQSDGSHRFNLLGECDVQYRPWWKVAGKKHSPAGFANWPGE